MLFIVVVNGDIVDGYRRKNDRERRESVSTHQTEKTERYELEESSEFLQPMDDHDRRAQNILDELDYQAMEEMQTRLHPPNSNMHFSYNRVPWKLKVRKEVFSPSEQLTNPTTIHVVFCQIVFDTFSPLCIRLTQSERRKMMGYMDKYDIDPKNVHSSQHKNSTKINILAMAKDFSTYFSRIYPVASSDQDVDVQYLAVSHTGVKLVRREKSLPTDYLKVGKDPAQSQYALPHISVQSVIDYIEFIATVTKQFGRYAPLSILIKLGFDSSLDG